MRISPILSGTAVIAAIFLCAANSWAVGTQTLGEKHLFCAAATSKAEREAGIPRHLLTAISLAESGRWDARRQASFAWPWTVTAEGKGRFLPSRAAAVRAVEGLRARGVRNIDVGCMQINLMHHADAFPSLTDAFDPHLNAAYAARFLGQQYAATGSWTKAAGAYHSKTPHLNKAYREKVRRLWKVARRQPAAPRPGPAAAIPDGSATSTFVLSPIDREWTARLNAQGRKTRTASSPHQGEKALGRSGIWHQSRVGPRPPRARPLNAKAQPSIARQQTGKRNAAAAAAFAAKRQMQLAQWRQSAGTR